MYPILIGNINQPLVRRTKMVNIKGFIEVGVKYGFPVVQRNNYIVMKTNNTDGKMVNWIKYMPKSDTVTIIGNTDNMNIWLHETRPDMTVDRCIQFIKELSDALDCRLRVKELIDPEDWQEIANISDAAEDIRY